jgi:hypothetical protein
MSRTTHRLFIDWPSAAWEQMQDGTLIVRFVLVLSMAAMAGLSMAIGMGIAALLGHPANSGWFPGLATGMALFAVGIVYVMVVGIATGDGWQREMFGSSHDSDIDRLLRQERRNQRRPPEDLD